MPVSDPELMSLLFSQYFPDQVWVVKGSDFSNEKELRAKAAENLVPDKFHCVHLFQVSDSMYFESNFYEFLSRDHIVILGIENLSFKIVDKLMEYLPLSVTRIGIQSLHIKTIDRIYKKVKERANVGISLQIICGNDVPDESRNKIARLYEKSKAKTIGLHKQPIVLTKPSSTQAVMANLSVLASPVNKEVKVVRASKRPKLSPSDSDLTIEQKQALEIQKQSTEFHHLQIRYESEKRARVAAESTILELRGKIQIYEELVRVSSAFALSQSSLSMFPFVPNDDIHPLALAPLPCMPESPQFSGSRSSLFPFPPGIEISPFLAEEKSDASSSSYSNSGATEAEEEASVARYWADF